MKILKSHQKLHSHRMVTSRNKVITMIVSAAPLIHARTKNVDFRSNLLVVPSSFDSIDVQWVRKYITDSTRYFELANEYGRKVVCSNNNYIITGLSIRIGDLYRLCNKEPQYDRVDGNRVNYAFIGFALEKHTVTEPIDIPYSAYLEQFEKYMGLRWNDSINESASLLHTRVEYCNLDFPRAANVSNILNIAPKSHPVAIDSSLASIEAISAEAIMLAAKCDNFAFCSDLPNATSVVDSQFGIVTSANAKSINDSINRSQKSTNSSNITVASTASINKSPARSTYDLLQDLTVSSREKTIKKKTNKLPWAIIITIIVVSLIALLLLKRIIF